VKGVQCNKNYGIQNFENQSAFGEVIRKLFVAPLKIREQRTKIVVIFLHKKQVTKYINVGVADQILTTVQNYTTIRYEMLF